MAKILDGKEVANAINQKNADRVSEIISSGSLVPKLAVVCVGDSASNASYLKGIEKRASEAGVLYDLKEFPEDISIEKLCEQIERLNEDEKVNGILLLRPLAGGLKQFEADICEKISPEKDVDAATKLSVAGAYLGSNAYAPCTAESCVAILDHFGIDIEGKHVVVIGRSLVVGKPVANMLLNRNATVTVCHSKTENIASISKKADIVVVATGTANKFGAKYFSKGQVVIDAGINWDPEAKKLCGDVDFEAVEPIVDAITPVPGGVGSVTSAILIQHTTQP